MRITRYPYCIQCVDAVSGRTGDFAYDPAKGYPPDGKFHAITPIFQDLAEFYAWCKRNNFYYHHGRSREVTHGEL